MKMPPETSGPPESPIAAPTTPPVDQDTLDIKELARAVLARSVRPRAASVRRLAEAVLAKGAHKAKKRKKADKKGKSKARKLATIPGQKDRIEG